MEISHKYKDWIKLIKRYKEIFAEKCCSVNKDETKKTRGPTDKTTQVEMYYFAKDYCVGQLLEPVEKDSRFVDRNGNPIVYGGKVRKWRNAMMKIAPFLFKKPKQVAVHITPIGLMCSLGPANSKRDPKRRSGWKKFNKYFDESTIKYKLS